MNKIITILGARPQFVKAAAVSNLLREHFDEKIIHTGQHFDTNMSDVFFRQLNIPLPDYNLNLHSFTHGKLTGLMIIDIEKILLEENPKYVLVYGDTNSTLAGAIAASKLNIPVIHIEAGARNFDLKSPEEINRKVTDHVSNFFFCCTQNCVKNLENEGINRNVFFTGDVMYDIFVKILPEVQKYEDTHLYNPFYKNEYIFLTLHRQENVDNKDKLLNIINSILETNENFIFPIHPRTRNKLKEFGLINILKEARNIKILPPLGYLEAMYLEYHSKKIVTDSGGVQREAYFMRKPCVTILDKVLWPSLLEIGANIVLEPNSKEISSTIKNIRFENIEYGIFGDGNASKNIVDALLQINKSL